VPAHEPAAVFAGAGVGWIAQSICSDDLACSSSGVDSGLVISAITKRDIAASNLTVSVKFFVSGLSKLKTIGKKSRR